MLVGDYLVGDYVEALRREGARLADTADGVDPAAPVPTCPEWTVRELVRHLGGIHRWAATYVAQARTDMFDDPEIEEIFETRVDDADLVGWFRDGHTALVRALEAAPADLTCWAFLPAPTPLAFWARRQAHETAIHRADVESVVGPVTGFPAGFAADGIDELLTGFVPRPRTRLRSDPPRTLQVNAADAGRTWTVHIGPDEVSVERDAVAEGAGCVVEGGASDVYLMLWNRRGTEGLAVSGDPETLELWRRSVTIRWS